MDILENDTLCLVGQSARFNFGRAVTSKKWKKGLKKGKSEHFLGCFLSI
jgi:hypothetical protein